MEYKYEDVKQTENTLALLKSELTKIINMINCYTDDLNNISHLKDLKLILKEALYIDSQMGVSIYPYSYLANECINIINDAEKYINIIEQNNELTV